VNEDELSHARSDEHLTSVNSGSYAPGPMDETSLPTAELAIVQAHVLDLAIEEFPEGPYGAATNEAKLGKVSEWKQGQAVSPRFRDANPIETDRKVAIHEPPFDRPKGSLDGQN